MEDKHSLEERVLYLERRVQELENKLSTSDKEPLIPKVPLHPSVQEKNNKKKQPIEWDVLIFQKIFPRVFIIVLIIGILWGFKAASDYGLLTASLKVTLGYIVSGGLIALGILQFNRDRRGLAQVLVGGAIPVLMITTFAMHQLYGLTGPEISFTLNIFWIILGLYFTYKYSSQGIALVSSIGGVFVPFLIESTTPNIPVFVFYEIILYTLFILLALKYRYKMLYFVSAIFLNIALFLFFIFTNVPAEYKWVAVSPIIVQQFALLIGFLKTNQLLKQQAYTLFSSIILVFVWIDFVLTNAESAIVFGLLAVIYTSSFFVYKTDMIRAPIFIANALMGLLFVSQMLFDPITFEVLIGSSILYLFVAVKYKSLFHAFLGGIFYLGGFTQIFEQAISAWISWEMLHWIVFLGATGYALYYLAKTKKSKAIYSYGSPYFALMMMIFLSFVSTLLAANSSDNMERMITSILWIGCSILFMVLSKPLAITQGKYIGVSILFITLAKIIMIDIHFISVTVRALLFILLGIIGLLVSRTYYKK